MNNKLTKIELFVRHTPSFILQPLHKALLNRYGHSLPDPKGMYDVTTQSNFKKHCRRERVKSQEDLILELKTYGYQGGDDE